MADYITKIRTADGDLPYDYNSLANLPNNDWVEIMNITTTEEANMIVEPLTEEFISLWQKAKMIQIYTNLKRPSVIEGLTDSMIADFGIYSNQSGTGGWFKSKFPISQIGHDGGSNLKLFVPTASWMQNVEYNATIFINNLSYAPQNALFVIAPQNQGSRFCTGILTGYKDAFNTDCAVIINSTNPFGVGTNIVVRVLL